MSKAGKMPFTERALAQLTLVRFREFIREPEVLFWVFVFPILLAAGLGIAFRNRPPEVLKIAATTAELARSLAGEKLLRVEHLPYTCPKPKRKKPCAWAKWRWWPGRARTARWFTATTPDRKSTRLNSSHLGISYAVFCLKKKK